MSATIFQFSLFSLLLSLVLLALVGVVAWVSWEVIAEGARLMRGRWIRWSMSQGRWVQQLAVPRGLARDAEGVWRGEAWGGALSLRQERVRVGVWALEITRAVVPGAWPAEATLEVFADGTPRLSGAQAAGLARLTPELAATLCAMCAPSRAQLNAASVRLGDGALVVRVLVDGEDARVRMERLGVLLDQVVAVERRLLRPPRCPQTELMYHQVFHPAHALAWRARCLMTMLRVWPDAEETELALQRVVDRGPLALCIASLREAPGLMSPAQWRAAHLRVLGEAAGAACDAATDAARAGSCVVSEAERARLRRALVVREGAALLGDEAIPLALRRAMLPVAAEIDPAESAAQVCAVVAASGRAEAQRALLVEAWHAGVRPDAMQVAVMLCAALDDSVMELLEPMWRGVDEETLEGALCAEVRHGTRHEVRVRVTRALGRLGGRESLRCLSAVRATLAGPALAREIDAALAQIRARLIARHRGALTLSAPRGGELEVMWQHGELELLDAPRGEEV